MSAKGKVRCLTLRSSPSQRQNLPLFAYLFAPEVVARANTKVENDGWQIDSCGYF